MNIFVLYADFAIYLCVCFFVSPLCLTLIFFCYKLFMLISTFFCHSVLNLQSLLPCMNFTCNVFQLSLITVNYLTTATISFTLHHIILLTYTIFFSTQHILMPVSYSLIYLSVTIPLALHHIIFVTDTILISTPNSYIFLASY